MVARTKTGTSWSINEIARMTGLTSRALRHYDAIGLLAPAWTADGGRRYYGERQGLPVGDPRVQEAIARHYEIVSWVWTPTAETYVALGQGYVAHAGFRKNIGQGDDALVTYLADAMKVFAADKLSR